MARKTIVQTEENLKQVYSIIERYPDITASEISKMTGFSFYYIKNLLKSLASKNKIKINNKFKKYVTYKIR